MVSVVVALHYGLLLHGWLLLEASRGDTMHAYTFTPSLTPSTLSVPPKEELVWPFLCSLKTNFRS